MAMSKECTSLFLVGKTGTGKSTTGNTVLGEELFLTLPSFDSVTSVCIKKTKERDGQTIHVVDSPGLWDTKSTMEERCMTIMDTVAQMHPGPDAILYIVSLAGRYTAEEDAVYQRLKAIFDDTICCHLIVVFTHGDVLKRANISINDLIGPDKARKLQQVLEDCNNRYAVIDNTASDPAPQVKRLLEMVEALKKENGGQPYSCPKYASIGDKIDKEVARRLEEVETQELREKKPFQQLERRTQESEDDMRKIKKEMEELKSANMANRGQGSRLGQLGMLVMEQVVHEALGYATRKIVQGTRNARDEEIIQMAWNAWENKSHDTPGGIYARERHAVSEYYSISSLRPFIAMNDELRLPFSQQASPADDALTRRFLSSRNPSMNLLANDKWVWP